MKTEFREKFTLKHSVSLFFELNPHFSQTIETKIKVTSIFMLVARRDFSLDDAAGLCDP